MSTNKSTNETSPTRESTFERYYTPVKLEDIGSIGIGTTYFYHTGSSIRPLTFPSARHSVEDLKVLASRGQLFQEILNLGDLISRNWVVDLINDDEVTLSKMVRLQTLYVDVDFRDHLCYFYTKSFKGEVNTSFRGVIFKVVDFDKVIKLIGFE